MSDSNRFMQIRVDRKCESLATDCFVVRLGALEVKCMFEDFVNDAEVFGYLPTPTCISVTRAALARVLRLLMQHLMLVARDPKFAEECLVTKSSITSLGATMFTS